MFDVIATLAVFGVGIILGHNLHGWWGDAMRPLEEDEDEDEDDGDEDAR